MGKEEEEELVGRETFVEEMMNSSKRIESHLDKLQVLNKEFCIRPMTTKSNDGQKKKGRFSSQVDPWVFQPKCQACVREVAFLRKQGVLESDILKKDSRCRKCNATLLELSNQFVKMMRVENFRYLHAVMRTTESEGRQEETKTEASQQVEEEAFAGREEVDPLEHTRKFLRSELSRIDGDGALHIPSTSKLPSAQSAPFLRSCLDAVEDTLKLYRSQDDEKTRVALRKRYLLFEKAMHHWTYRVSGKAFRKWKLETGDILERVKM
ncbi:hypothetical protein GUITHDRAFT_132481 [Guillardia theta CCMP2712]|uniref:Uncharacterized protein n=1 Tax=Guillardia theta (strain CCMP2712) TaxID=905079 RepID=L1K0B5_GUITC|nr:hypothetical protein GUITHDRAFT_132481 [Guillardia theta CCMP2712]EKX54072.1 hypothetical protein GUITHDRAFT_132481 [Guillardia theta CCMP2712]|eukprot:XP_005841052.1 hypothetical protein GUITHDRAFT_132481 [Guillardia theta CCMP2712]